MTQQKSLYKKYAQNETFWIVLISIFFAVGIVGISLPEYRDTLVPLSSLHLLLTFVVLRYSRKTKKGKFFLFAFLIFVVGMLVEAIGTNSGWLFGEYQYGETLGP